MGGSTWSWQQTPFEWWTGRRDGFDGVVSVFERMGAWCVRVEIAWDGILDLVHFSEGYASLNRAKNEAQCAADLALALRRSSRGVPSG